MLEEAFHHNVKSICQINCVLSYIYTYIYVFVATYIVCI